MNTLRIPSLNYTAAELTEETLSQVFANPPQFILFSRQGYRDELSELKRCDSVVHKRLVAVVVDEHNQQKFCGSSKFFRLSSTFYYFRRSNFCTRHYEQFQIIIAKNTIFLLVFLCFEGLTEIANANN